MVNTMTDYCLASGNQGKLREFNALLGEHSMNFRPQSEFNAPDAEETGLTFVENAIIKARSASEASGLPALADDSGIEVDALNGAPGIYSARYSAMAGGEPGDVPNLLKLLEDMKDVPEAQRTARFRCLIVLLKHPEDPAPLIAQGAWEGRILFEPLGENGFGYDPVFWVPTHECSSAQLDPAVKNQISHRGQALRSLLAQLRG